MKYLLITISIVFSVMAHAATRPCVNPISTVDWRFFADQLHLSGTCMCTDDANVKVGLKWRVAEPIAFIEVTGKSFNYPCIGVRIAKSKKQNSSNYSNHGVKRNTHYIKYPVFGMLNMVMDYLCIDNNTQFDIAPPSELDPRQNTDLAVLFQPDKLAFAAPLARPLDFADCVSTSVGYPLNQIYWNAGCWGSLINIANQSEGTKPVEEAALLAAKQLDLLHADFQLWKYSDAPGLDFVSMFSNAGGNNDTSCQPRAFARLIKSQYWLQLAYPTTSKAFRIGDFSPKWALFKQYPTGEEFVFTVWRIRDCCAGFQLF